MRGAQERLVPPYRGMAPAPSLVITQIRRRIVAFSSPTSPTTVIRTRRIVAFSSPTSPTTIRAIIFRRDDGSAICFPCQLVSNRGRRLRYEYGGRTGSLLHVPAAV